MTHNKLFIIVRDENDSGGQSVTRVILMEISTYDKEL